MSRHSDNTSSANSSDAKTDTLSTAQIIDTLLKLKDEAHMAEPNAQWIKQLTHALFDRYLATSYAAAFEDPLEGPRLLTDAAAMHSGVAIIGISSRELEELLFDALGPGGEIDEKNAVNVVGSARAFFDWLGREFHLDQAAELVDLLGNDAVRELERGIASGIRAEADALLIEAQAAGVDLTDKRALEQFLLSRIAEDEDIDPDSWLDDTYTYDFDATSRPSAPTLTPEQKRSRQKKRKKNRKTARKARKKNR